MRREEEEKQWCAGLSYVIGEGKETPLIPETVGQWTAR